MVDGISIGVLIAERAEGQAEGKQVVIDDGLGLFDHFVKVSVDEDIASGELVGFAGGEIEYALGDLIGGGGAAVFEKPAELGTPLFAAFVGHDVLGHVGEYGWRGDCENLDIVFAAFDGDTFGQAHESCLGTGVAGAVRVGIANTARGNHVDDAA